MRRFMIAVVVFGILLNTGLTFAQDQDTHQMPEKVRAFLGKLIGTWDIEGGQVKGQAVYQWDPAGRYVVGTGRVTRMGEPFNDTSLWCWDGTSADGIVIYSTSSRGHAVDHARIVSENAMKGSGSGVEDAKEGSGQIQVAHEGPARFTMTFTDQIKGGEKAPDWTGVFTRVKPTTREDFEEYCRLNEGAWVGKTPLRADMPDIGKKGETATAHYDYTIIEDGTGLLGKSYWPGGTNTWLIAYDEEDQQIKSIGISPIFGVDAPIIHYKNRIWTCRERAMNPDGTKYEATITGTFSEDGKTMTVTVSGPNGEKAKFTDVWHRMNK